MRYKSVFSVSFNAQNDDAAREVARLHHELLRDELRVEGADHPIDLILEQVVAIDHGEARMVPASRISKSI